MGNLADFRAKYPGAYDHVDDQALADAIYKKYYPQADRREFDARIGLKPYDNLGTGIVKGAQNAWPSIQQSFGGLQQELGEAMTEAVSPTPSTAPPSSPLMQVHEAISQFPGNAISAVARMLPQDRQQAIAETGAKESLRGQLLQQAAEKNLQTVDAPTLSAPAIASTVTTSTIQMVPSIMASILLRNPSPALATAFGQSSGQAYGQGRAGDINWEKGFFDEASKQGLTPAQAREYATLYGAAEAIPEALPLGEMLKEGGKLAVRVGKTALTEGVSEGITQAAQSALDKGYIKPDMTWGEAWPQIVQAMAAGAISGGLFGAIAHGEQKALNRDGTLAAPEPDVGTADTVSVDMPVEQRLGLPGPGRILALPSPDAFAPNAALAQRRVGPAPPVPQESLPPSSEQVDYQARIALQKTRQQETADLLKTAREAVTPLGTFTKDEIGGPAAQRVNQLRIQTGRPLETPVTIDELARAKVPQQTIDAVISARRPMTTGQALTPLDITTAAKAKNIIADDGNFAELAQRATGQRNIDRMTQAQLNALKTTIDSLPAHPAPVTVPIADQSPYTDEMYGKALDAVRNQGRYTASAIKDATGLKRTEDVQAIRDAMVRRGQLVKRGEGDYRLFDIVGQERQAVPDDLPPGAFTEHVVRRIPVNKIQIKKNGKSLGTFGSASEARGKIRDLRAEELGKGTRAQIELAPAADVAYGVMQNRYDEQGNLLGQVVVDTHRSEEEANRAAAELNTPDTGARYTQTSVTPTPGGTPLSPPRQIEPAALAGRVPEIVKRLNKIAADRKLPMLGVRVSIKPRITTPEGTDIEGLYFQKLIELTTQNLDASMTTDQLVDRLAQVMDHESIHALRAAGVLAPETSAWKTLSRYTKRAKRGQTGETYFEWANRAYAGVPGYETLDSREEEAIAEAFRAWATNRRAVAGAPGTAFRQIVEWFKRLLAAVPDDLFKSIETGRMVAEALTPPGANLPRAKATQAMTTASEGLKAADAAQDENAARVMSRDFLRAQAQAREDRYGRSGPKTILGTNPTAAYDSAPIADRAQVAKIVDKYKSEHGVQASRLMTLLPEDLGYLSRIADAQQKALHDPKAVDVAKAYSALIDETRAMFKALGPLEIVPQTKAGSPYASAKELMDDIATGRLVMRTSTDMFGEGADNPGHPMYEKSGYSTTEGTPLVYNDLLRIVHDVYGHGQSGFRDDPRGQYNAYHEHARLLSPLAARALATETLAQNAWQNYGPHLRRRDGTVPRETDVDYLPPMQKEFALQKAFVLPEELIAADPGWALAERAESAEAPKFSKFDEDLPGGRLYGNPNKSPGGQLSKPETPTPAFTSDRPGNRFFGGEMAEHQLQMARTGERGAALVYITPQEFLDLTGAAANPEQAVYDDAVAAGYKLSTMPSLVIDGYAGIVRAVDGDSHAGAAALVNEGEPIPVVLYPKKGQSLGLVTALEGNGVRVAWPHEGRAENFPEDRIDGEPRYSLNAPYGTRVPDDGPADAFNIVQQRTDTRIGAFLGGLGRNKRHIPGIGSIFQARLALDDKWLSWKELMEDTRRDHGIVNDINDVYMLAQLYDGKVFEQISQREEDLHKPLLDALKLAHDGPLKIQPKEFEDYLYARHAPERNAYLRTRGSPIDNPSGMSDAEANATLNKFALDGKLPEMESLARLADKITLDTTRTRVEAGLITAEAEQSSPYRYYVPLKGFADEELDPGNPSENQTRARTGKGFSVGGREDRTVKGRSRKAGDILGHLFLQNTEAVIRAGKNEVALAGAHFLKDNGTTFGTGRILTVAPSRLVVGANGMIHEAGDPSYRQRPDIVIAKWKGQEIVMQFEDPQLARALKSDYTSTSDGLLNALNTIGALMNRYLPINKVLATVNTALSPVFILTNPLKDAQTAAILGAQYDIKNFSMKMIAGAPKAIVGIREVMRNGTAEGEWAQLFKQMQAAGGTTEFMGIHDLEAQVARIRRSVSQTGLAVTARQAGQYLGHVTKFISDYNKVAENALRLSAFKVALDAGVSEPRAAYLAKNLTVNFNKGGEAKVFANAAYLFYNASTQGSMGILRGLKNKRVQRLVGGVVVAGLLQDLINRMISGDSDDNGVTDYDDVPDYVLQTNLVLMDPLHLTGPRGYFSFPMPYGFNAFYNLGRNMGKGIGGQMLTDVQGKKTVVPGNLMDAGVDSLLGFVNAFNPLGGVQNIANFIAPTIADPFVDVMVNNADYTGAKIVPDRFDVGGVPVPDSQKYWSNTGEVPKAIAEQLNHLTGGNDVRKGLIDVSPEVLQYGFDYVTGALGKLVQRAAVTGSAVPGMLRGDFSNVDVGNIPFAQRFVGNVGSRGNTERFYSVAREVATVRQELQTRSDAGDTAGTQDIIARHPTELKLMAYDSDTGKWSSPMFMQGEQALADMRKQIRSLRDNKALSEKTRAEAVKKLKDAQDLLMAQMNRAYFAAKQAKAKP